MSKAALLPSSVEGAGGVFAVLLVVCLLAAACPAFAATDEEQQRGLLDLVVNEVPRGQVLTIVRGKDVLLPIVVLEQAGLGNFAGQRESIDAQAWVSLTSLSPGITFVLDDRALTVRVTAAAQHLVATTRLDFRNADRPAFERRRDTSGFVNYAMNWRQYSGYGATTELGVSARGALVSSTVSWNESNGAVRGLSSMTLDRPGALRRIALGDSFVSDRQLGGSTFLGGIRVASEYSIDPYFLRYPTLGLAGVVTTPSNLDVYVDNRLVRTEQLAPGKFQLANLPVPVGSSQTRLVIRDAFGREQQVTTPFYLASTVLAKGLHEYEYALGAVRNDVSRSSWDYGPLSLFARHRYGFSDFLTAGFRLEARSGLVSAGPSLNARLPLGEVELAAAASRADGRPGTAVSAGYAYTGRAMTGGVTLRAYADDYRTLSATSEAVPRREMNGFLGLIAGRRGSLMAQYARTENRRGSVVSRATVFGTTRVSPRGSLFFSIGRRMVAGQAQAEFSIGLNLALANTTSATASMQSDGNGATVGAEVQRALPIGSGYGYRVRAAGGPGEGSGARLLYQTSYGRYDLERETLAGTATTSFNLSGGLVAIGGRVLPTRPVDQGFALVRVPDVPGVRTYLSNQEIGRTDKHGDLFIPNLLAYYANRLRVADQDIPIDRAVASVERHVAPPLRGGALVVFDAARVRSVSGRIEFERDGEVVTPDFGDLSVEVEGKRVESPVGRDGEYYLENLKPGDYLAEVKYKGAACTFTVRVPAADGPVVNLGVSRCVAGIPR